ncbi:hypothetical protein LOC67_13140 [Stieleria sp. JC731]|uniref:hypothetical protein n=1 Tax=Pirellulaceae TaxID=2691357 RepID=UPI001E332712|nr:hypothetical protein [Stieleria sp. JC731]MCC9601495.1 hypothetical protein [Stieleria sp. JC731]
MTTTATIDSFAVDPTSNAPGKQRWFRSSKQRTTSFVGIEISESEVRVACLKRNREQSFDWSHLYRFELPVMPGGEPTLQWLHEVMHTIHLRLPRPIEGDRCECAIALPLSWTQYQTVLGHELENVRRRSTQLFSESVFESQAHICHWPIAGIHCGHPGADDQYVIAATARRATCHLVDIASSLGYQVHSVLPHAVALTHASLRLTSVDAQCVLWLDHQASLISVRHSTGVGLSRSLSTLPARLADLAVSKGRQGQRPLDAYTLRPYLSDIAAEFERTAKYAARAENVGSHNAASRHKDSADKPILLAGPLAAIEGVDEILATICNVPVATWTFAGRRRPVPTTRATGPTNKVSSNDSRCDDVRFATALSLACLASDATKQGYGK